MTVKYLDAKRVQGSSTASLTFTPAGSFNVEYLVVGGGGGAQSNNSGVVLVVHIEQQQVTQ